MTAVVNQVEMPLHVNPHPLVAAAATFFFFLDNLTFPLHISSALSVLSLPLTVTLPKLKM